MDGEEGGHDVVSLQRAGLRRRCQGPENVGQFWPIIAGITMTPCAHQLLQLNRSISLLHYEQVTILLTFYTLLCSFMYLFEFGAK